MNRRILILLTLVLGQSIPTVVVSPARRTLRPWSQRQHRAHSIAPIIAPSSPVATAATATPAIAVSATASAATRTDPFHMF